MLVGMGAPSKRAKKIRSASEFDLKRLTALLEKPREGGIPVTSWSLARIFEARDAQMRGDFWLPAKAAESMATDDALQVARENRLDPQRCIDVEMKPAGKGRAESIAGEAEALFGKNGVGLTIETLADVNLCLADHGLSVGCNVTTPRLDGSRVDYEMRYWPLEHVRYDRYDRVLKTRIDPESIADKELTPQDRAMYSQVGFGEVPIIHGDGRWVVFQKHSHEPWKKSAAVLAALLVWARHAYALRDWAKASVAHGNAKMIGEMAEGVRLQEDGELTKEAAAFLELLAALMSEDSPIGIRPFGSKTDFVANNSTAYQVWLELVNNAEKAAARIYLGTDGILGAQGGAPGVDITALFGVALTKVKGDFDCMERAILTGLIEPWCAVNFGDSTLAPRRRYCLPDPDREATFDAEHKRRLAFFEAIAQAKTNGFVVDQAYVEQLAEKYDVDAPALVGPAVAATLARAA